MSAGARTSITGQPWINYKNAMRDHVCIRFELDTSRCITRTRPNTYSPGGCKEHQRTGVCEACWDVLAPGGEETQSTERCDRLRADASCHNFVSDWIAQCRCPDNGIMRTTEANVKRIVSIGAGLETLPDIWRPGLRPAPWRDQELRCFAMRMPLWATRWLRCIRMPKNMSIYVDDLAAFARKKGCSRVIVFFL